MLSDSLHRVILGSVIFQILLHKAVSEPRVSGGEILLLGNRRDPWLVLGK